MAASLRSCRWSAKHYILAALLGTQVAIVIAIVFSVILAPAHISFSITNAKTNNGGPDSKERYYYFTLVSDNNSSHKEVKFSAINFEIWYSTYGSSVADLGSDKLPGGWQPPLNKTYIDVMAPYWQYDIGNVSRPASTTSDVDPSDAGNVVVVIALAQFKVAGTIPTRQYKIRVFCQPVHFHFNSTDHYSPVNCTG